MANFILIHGACHGGWCWRYVVNLLQASGHGVIAPDLPGHGDDNTPMSVLSLDVYGNFVSGLVQAASKPVYLVGHSMAGAVISRVAETVTDSIACLIYLTAYLPKSGQSLASLARHDTEALTASKRITIDGTDCFIIDPEVLRCAFYHDANEEVFEFAMGHIQAEPIRIFHDKTNLSNSQFGSVPRAYIHCTDDKAIGYNLQREMVKILPCDPVISLECGHSPFLTNPKKLVDALLSISH